MDYADLCGQLYENGALRPNFPVPAIRTYADINHVGVFIDTYDLPDPNQFNTRILAVSLPKHNDPYREYSSKFLSELNNRSEDILEYLDADGDFEEYLIYSCGLLISVFLLIATFRLYIL